MLSGERKGIIVENPDRSDEVKFLTKALIMFPFLADDFVEYEGLLHPQMGAFSLLVQDAIERGDLIFVQRCFSFQEETLKNAKFNLQNAICVSFLENLNFDNPRGVEARQLLPDLLLEMLIDLEEYLHLMATTSNENCR